MNERVALLLLGSQRTVHVERNCSVPSVHLMSSYAHDAEERVPLRIVLVLRFRALGAVKDWVLLIRVWAQKFRAAGMGTSSDGETPFRHTGP